MTKVTAGSAAQDVLARLEQAEAELDALRGQLDHCQQLATLGTLTAGIAHEINNILTPVLAYAQLASSNPNDTGLRAKALDRAIAGVEAASRITEAVLGFARNDDAAEQVGIADAVGSSIACLSRDPARDGVRVVVNVDNDLHVQIRPLALQQVLLNLILNALSVLHGKPGELRIEAAQHPDGSTRIRVSDTGPGIPAEIAATLFDPFVTTRGPARPSPTGHGGSGLGLAVCRRLVENNGGTIVLEPVTEDRQGASFLVSLPTAVAVPEPKKAA